MLGMRMVAREPRRLRDHVVDYVQAQVPLMAASLAWHCDARAPSVAWHLFKMFW
jgi:hypothetical protein